MHYFGASSFALTLMATAASAPFFIFTLPAGAVADIVNRRALIVSAVLWQGACSAFLAFGHGRRQSLSALYLSAFSRLGLGLRLAPRFGEPLFRTSLVKISSPPRSRWEECN
jgi:MFS family permease